MGKQNIKSTRKMQIGVMGSAADLKYAKGIERLAEEIGYCVAKKGATLIFGAEKDYDSLSTAACRGAKNANGLTVGITYGKGLDIFEKNADVVIASGLERGGGRETSLVLSCDAIIALSGGSGTLTEIAIAYQANIPVVVLKGTGGWSNKLGGKYIDSRKRLKVEVAKTPKKAVSKAIKLVKQKKKRNNKLLFLTATHGDEKIGVEALKSLEKQALIKNYDWIIANEKAFKKGKRFIKLDLNRVAPGDKDSKKYELRRAYEILKLAKDYETVIDIHETKSKTGIFTIVTNPTLKNLALAHSLPIERIVIWAAESSKNKGPISQFVTNGVEIECGLSISKTILKELVEILKLITQLKDKQKVKKQLFRIYGKVLKNDISKSKAKRLVNFKKYQLNGETFYPLLVGQYKNIVCYKMEKVNFWNLFAY